MKYFNEMKGNPHLDVRYGKKNLSQQIIRTQLKNLLKQTVNIFKKVDIPCIIMHGSLIGWYFGKKILPWDDDIDIVILEEYREKLKTLNGFQNNKILIEVNPVIDTIKRDINNIIEARVICKITGVFIDITNISKGNVFKIGNSSTNIKAVTFRLNQKYNINEKFLFKIVKHKYNDQFDIRYKLIENNKIKIIVKRIDQNKGWNLNLCLFGYDRNIKPLYNKNVINCFSPHYYNIDDIYPLKKTTFENIEVYVPNNIEKVLVVEYGKNVLKPYYKNYIYKNNSWLIR